MYEETRLIVISNWVLVLVFSMPWYIFIKYMSISTCHSDKAFSLLDIQYRKRDLIYSYHPDLYTIGRSIFRTLFKSKFPERNELFLPGRMAYVVDLEDDYAENDVPCTTIRSKADCPSLEVCTHLSNNVSHFPTALQGHLWNC